ncbi:MAG: amidohydrolase family protein [Burkholderiales bacterium]|nr:amidohydrolase family protein [Bacteroidia bacterium]
MRYVTADRIFSGKEYLPKNTVLAITNEGVLTDLISEENSANSNIERLNGIICPGFINTHCHLELSHLKGIIKQHTGIVDFGLSVIKHRNDQSPEEQIEAMLHADAEMQKQGIVAVGDISNTSASIAAKKKSDLYYHTFVELIALNPERSEIVFEEGKQLESEFKSNNLSASLAPHAPYSASLKLIEQLSNHCYSTKQPTSIHNQESKAENDFFINKTGNYLRLYETLNIAISYFKPTQKSSLQSVINAFNIAVNTLMVHNTFTNKEDLQVAQSFHKQLYWCLCPKANLFIENLLPDIQLMISNNCKLTFGTDSLASNTGLSIIDEINTIVKKNPEVSFELLLKAATYDGAEFLGIEDQFGSLLKNRKCGINLIEENSGNYTIKKLA